MLTVEVVGHMQQNISMSVSLFLSLLRYVLDISATRKHVNCRGKYELKIPTNFNFYGPEIAIKLAKKQNRED